MAIRRFVRAADQRRSFAPSVGGYNVVSGSTSVVGPRSVAVQKPVQEPSTSSTQKLQL